MLRVMVRRAVPVERAWARVFREAGARVVAPFFLRDSSLSGVRPEDRRKIEILATGLPLYRGVPLAVDATVVAPLHADGLPWPDAATTDGVALARGEKAKLDRYPELVDSTVVRLVTVASEVGGRWSPEAQEVLGGLATARARSAPAPLRSSARAAWMWRWSCQVSVAVQAALAATLVDAVPVELDGADGPPPPDATVCADLA